MRRLFFALLCLIVVALPVSAQENIVVYGDSLGDGLWSGLVTVLKKSPNCKVLRHSKIGAGLTRADYLNWIEELPKQIEADQPKIAFLLFGANDQQGLRDDKKGHSFKSSSWKDAYSSRISAIIKELKEKAVKVFWIALPIMAEEETNLNAGYLNEIFQENAARENIAFLAIVNDFADKDGKFITHMNDPKGRSQQIRKNDGIHFTGYGYELLAAKVWEKALKILGEQNLPDICK